jgi:splicing factor 45
MPPPPPPPSVIAPAQQSPPAPPAGTISRAPVRYSLPEASTSLPSTDAELTAALRTNAAAEAAEEAADEAQDDRAEESPGPRSSAPGQKGFAERLMAKMGWTKGAGLGASESGMLAPLRVQMDKRKKKSDAEGGGFRGVQTAKIIGSKSGKGKKKEGEEDKEEVEEQGISEVVMLRGMVDGMDVRKEVENGLGQEIGEECGEKVCSLFIFPRCLRGAALTFR